MKTLIVYASKTGTTERCAEILGQNLKDATIINLTETQNEDINKYDLIIIGSPIRMGLIDKRVKGFISKNSNNGRPLSIWYFIFALIELFSNSSIQIESNSFSRRHDALLNKCHPGLKFKSSRVITSVYTGITELESLISILGKLIWLLSIK